MIASALPRHEQPHADNCIDTAELLARRISLAEHITNRNPPMTEMTVQEAIWQIRSGSWSAAVEAVRAARHINDAKAETLKRRLPALKPSGVFDGLAAKNLKAHSGILCIDLDDVADLAGTREKLKQDPHVFAVFLSASGTGLKAFVAVDVKTAGEHKEVFDVVREHFAKVGLSVDEHCSDVGRNCFVSHDPGVWTRPQGEGAQEFSLHTLHVSSSPSCLHALHASSCSSWHQEGIASVKTAELDLEQHPRIARIYRTWVERVEARPGERNKALTILVPRLYDKVSEDVLLWLMGKFYDLNAGIFHDPRNQHESEARQLILAVAKSYCDVQGLSADERVAYGHLDGKERVAFRICRSLAQCKRNEGKHGFGLSCDELAARIDLKPDPKGAHRLLSRFVAYRILEMVKKGQRQAVGGPRAEATVWKWRVSR